MMTLTLHLKQVYFDQIKAGEKLEEFREVTPYWKKRIEGKRFDNIVLLAGYPKTNDESRRIIKPWRGYREIKLKHEQFGNKTVDVYAIDVSGPELAPAV